VPMRSRTPWSLPNSVDQTNGSSRDDVEARPVGSSRPATLSQRPSGAVASLRSAGDRLRINHVRGLEARLSERPGGQRVRSAVLEGRA